MNNQFSQRVSDIIVYSKEEANRLRSRYIGPEHLLLGILRDGEGKAIEILSKLNTNLAAIKQQIEAQLKAEADEMLLPDNLFYIKREPNKTEIKAQLKSGADIEGCALVQGKARLTIK